MQGLKFLFLRSQKLKLIHMTILFWAGWMIQWIEALATMPDSQSLIPWTQRMVGGEDQHTVACVPTQINVIFKIYTELFLSFYRNFRM